MFRLLVISFLLTTCTKVILTEMQENNIDGEDLKDVYYANFGGSKNKDKIWVLELNEDGFQDLKLRVASKEEQEDFEFYSQPLIESYNKEHSRVVKKDAPKLTKAEDVDKKKPLAKKSASKKDIFKFLNKFALYSKTESDAYLSDSHENDGPSIALYFKGRFASLIVKQGIRQWHYFIPPPSSLPAWLHEAHDSHAGDGGAVDVPPYVKDKLYSPLLRLLQVLLRYQL